MVVVQIHGKIQGVRGFPGSAGGADALSLMKLRLDRRRNPGSRSASVVHLMPEDDLATRQAAEQSRLQKMTPELEILRAKAGAATWTL
jgi:hypothetical protein